MHLDQHIHISLDFTVTMDSSDFNPLTAFPLSPLDCQDVSDNLNAQREPLSLAETATDVSSSRPHFAQLQATVLDASKGVTDSTDAEYRR
jgi:hypothetical protein